MRKRYALKNVVSKALYATIYAVISFVARKIFINSLGDTVLGLNSLMTSILSMLSLMELGVGNAIYFSLYKPLAEGNDAEVNAIMKLYKRLYSYIGMAVGAVGLCILPFIHLLVQKEVGLQTVSMTFVYEVYLIFLADSVMSYFLAYRRNIFSADQKEYMVTNVNTVVTLGYTFLQIVALLWTKNYFIYLLIKVAATVEMNIYFYAKSYQSYPCLRIKEVQPLSEEYKKNLIKNVKALFMMSLSSFLVYSTDNMLLTYFVGLSSVAIYANYTTIINMVNQTFNTAISSMKSNVGNYLVTESEEQHYQLFKNMFFLNFLITGFTSIGLLTLSNEFIGGIWLSSKYVWPISILIIIVFNNYSRYIIEAAGVFMSGAGLYSPYPLYKYWSLIEGLINLAASIFMIKVLNMGVYGVFLGTSISTLVSTIAVPQVTFKYILKKNLKEYYALYFKYFILTVLFAAISMALFRLLHTGNAFVNIVIGGLISVGVMAVGTIALFRKTAEFQYLYQMVKGFLGKRKTN